MAKLVENIGVIVGIFLIILTFSPDSEASKNNEKISLTFGIYTDHIGSGEYKTIERESGFYKGNYYSYQYKKNNEYNEDNQLVGLEYENVLVGTFENSYRDRSYLAMYKFTEQLIYHNGVHNVSFKAYAGLTYGYKKKHLPNEMFIADRVSIATAIGLEYTYNERYSISGLISGNAFTVNVSRHFDIK